MKAPKNSRRLCSSVVGLGGPYRVPAAAMPRVKTVRRRLARANKPPERRIWGEAK